MSDADVREQAVAIVKVRSMAETLAWYRGAGFEVRGTFPDDDPTWAEVARDGTVLQFLAGETPWAGEPAFTGCFYIHPPSVRDVHDHVHGTVAPASEVEEREWGALELTLQDPNGYFVTFTEG